MGQNLTGKLVSATYEDLVQISGSILTNGLGTDITSITVTSSFASQAGTAGFASQAGTSGYASTSLSASFADTSSYASTSLSASYALTASYAENIPANTGFPYTGSAEITGSLSVTGSIAVQSGSYDGFVIDNLTTPTASEALEHIVVISQADFNALPSPDANTFYIINDATGSIVVEDLIVSGSLQVTGSAAFANGITGSLSGTASFASQAGTSGYAVTASYALSSSADNITLQQVTNNGATTTNQITASALYLTDAGATNVIAGNVEIKGTVTFVSSSTLQIGDNVIEINYNRAAGNSGILTYDTTSPFTASLLWDVTNDRWIAGPYGGESVIILASDTGSMSVASASFATTASYAVSSSADNITLQQVTTNGNTTTNNIVIGNRTYAEGYISSPSAAGYTITGGTSTATLVLRGNDTTSTNSITLNPVGSYNVTIAGNTKVNNDLYVSGSITGSLFGTASYATNANKVYASGSSEAALLPVILGSNGDLDTYTTTKVDAGASLGYDPSTSTLYSPTFSGNLSGNADTATTASFAITASYALNANVFPYTGSAIITGSLAITGSMIGQVNAISVASSTGSLDCSLGNYFTLGLANAADTRLEASNIKAGQTINIKITNNATAAGTISFGPEFEFEGGTPFTATAATSAVDIVTMVSFDGTSLQTVGVKNFS